MKLYAWIQKGWPPLASVILLLICWQTAVSLWDIDPLILPAPIDILTTLYDESDRLQLHVQYTVKIALLGFVIGSVVGIAIAVLFHSLPWTNRALHPLLIISQNIPTLALAPLLIVWFGFGLTPKIIVITLACFFPVAVALLQGLSQTDRQLLNYMRMQGASTYQIFMKLSIPYSLSYFFTGLKIAATYSVMGAVISEWLGAQYGLGIYLKLSQSSYQTTKVFAAILLIIVFSLCMYGLVAWLERRIVYWQQGKEVHDE